MERLRINKKSRITHTFQNKRRDKGTENILGAMTPFNPLLDFRAVFAISISQNNHVTNSCLIKYNHI